MEKIKKVYIVFTGDPFVCKCQWNYIHAIFSREKDAEIEARHCHGIIREYPVDIGKGDNL